MTNTTITLQYFAQNHTRWLILVIGILGVTIGCREKALIENKTHWSNGNVQEQWNENAKGLKQGLAITYHENGKKQTEGNFVNDYLHGEFVMWSKDGAELCRGIYQDGQPLSGTFVSVDEKQKRVIFKEYKDGELVNKK